MHNRSDARMNNAVVASEVTHSFACRVACADQADIVFGEFGVVMVRSARHDLWSNGCDCANPSFSVPIKNIVGLRPEPEMIGVDASGIVSARAVVKNLYPLGDRAAMQFPRNSMRQKCVSGFNLGLQLPMTEGDSRSGPQPTRRSLVDVAPKSNFHRLSAGHASAFTAAKCAATSIYVGLMNKVCPSTRLTNSFNLCSSLSGILGLRHFWSSYQDYEVRRAGSSRMLPGFRMSPFYHFLPEIGGFSPYRKVSQ
jgi:hypothetical protein